MVRSGLEDLAREFLAIREVEDDVLLLLLSTLSPELPTALVSSNESENPVWRRLQEESVDYLVVFFGHLAQGRLTFAKNGRVNARSGDRRERI